MPYCRCGNEFPEARARLGFDCCLECGAAEAAAETARRAHMIAPISHKSGYTYLGPDRAAQCQRLLEGSAKTPPMETDIQTAGRAARPRQTARKRYGICRLGVQARRAGRAAEAGNPPRNPLRLSREPSGETPFRPRQSALPTGTPSP
jgi:hypothetical protein